MSGAARSALRIESRHEERLVLLACDCCQEQEPISTRDAQFLPRLDRFFERHADCRKVLQLP